MASFVNWLKQTVTGEPNTVKVSGVVGFSNDIKREMAEVATRLQGVMSNLTTSGAGGIGDAHQAIGKIASDTAALSKRVNAVVKDLTAMGTITPDVIALDAQVKAFQEKVQAAEQNVVLTKNLMARIAEKDGIVAEISRLAARNEQGIAAIKASNAEFTNQFNAFREKVESNMPAIQAMQQSHDAKISALQSSMDELVRTVGSLSSTIRSQAPVSSGTSFNQGITVTTKDAGPLIQHASDGSTKDRYGLGQYPNGITRIYTSGEPGDGSVRLSVAMGDNKFNDVINANAGLVSVNASQFVKGSSIVKGVALFGDSVLVNNNVCFGGDDRNSCLKREDIYKIHELLGRTTSAPFIEPNSRVLDKTPLDDILKNVATKDMIFDGQDGNGNGVTDVQERADQYDRLDNDIRAAIRGKLEEGRVATNNQQAARAAAAANPNVMMSTLVRPQMAMPAAASQQAASATPGVATEHFVADPEFERLVSAHATLAKADATMRTLNNGRAIEEFRAFNQSNINSARVLVHRASPEMNSRAASVVRSNMER